MAMTIDLPEELEATLRERVPFLESEATLSLLLRLFRSERLSLDEMGDALGLTMKGRREFASEETVSLTVGQLAEMYPCLVRHLHIGDGHGDTPMSESYFWGSLEFRIGREFAKTGRRHMWCDGVYPEHFDFENHKVHGEIWICYDQHQQRYRFTLRLPLGCTSRESIPWKRIYPPEAMTCWIEVDDHNSQVILDFSTML